MALFILCPCRDAPAQTRSARFLQITEQQGLPQTPVTAFLKDSQGFMWIGTDEGLLRYDGYEHVRYTHDHQDPWSICNNQVSSLAQDRDGAIWVGSRSGGVSRLDPRSGRFTCFSPFAQEERSRMGREVFALFADSTGRIWLGGSPAIGLGYFDPGQELFIPLELPNVDLAGSVAEYEGHGNFQAGPPRLRQDVGSILDFLELEDTTLLAATDYGILVLTPGNRSMTFHQLEPTERRVARLTQDASGVIWACGTEGLYAFDPETGDYELYRAPQKLMGKDMVLTQDGLLWVASEIHQVLIFDPQARRFLEHSPDIRGSGWQGGRTNVLFLDESNILWIGTMRGVILSSPLIDRFNYVQIYSHDPGQEQRPVPLDVLGCDASGSVWIAAQGVLYGWRPLDNAWSSTPFNSDRSDAEELGAFSLTAMAEDSIWLGSTGVLVVDPAQGVEATYSLPRFRLLDPKHSITDMVPDPEHGVWVGAMHGGLALLDPETGEVLDLLRNPPEEQNQGADLSGTIMNPWVTALMRDSQGNLYVGYSEGGFSILDPALGSFDHHQAQGIHVSETVTAFFEGNLGEIWIATRMGLTRYDPATRAYQTFTQHDGLPGNSIRSLEMDGQGRLWLGTNAGLACLDPADDSIRVFDTRDGLGENQFLRGSCTMADGTMYFAHAMGITSFDPSRFQGQDQAPPPVLTGVRLFNEPVAPGPGSILSAMPGYAEAITLTPDMDVIGFEFSALNYLGAGKNRFQYRLEGLEDQWNEVGADRRFVTYTDLPPGRYVFRVRAASGAGPWSEQEVSLKVTVLPEWWETLPFRFSLVLGLVGGTYGAVRLRIRNLKRQRRRLKAQVAERTAELAKANATLENLAKVDGLTQVANRRRLDSFLDREWRALARARRPMGLILLDIDFFKRYNDTYGHMRGDECLRAVARAIADSVQRPMDLVARFGGEEFVVVMPDTDAQGAGHVAEKIRQRIAALGIEHKASDVADHVSISLGVASMIPRTGADPEALFQKADKALYQAKLQGRNQVVVLD